MSVDTIYGVVYIVVILGLVAVANMSLTARKRAVDFLGAIARALQNGNGTQSEQSERLAALESDVKAIRRDLNDIDEKAEARFNRLRMRAQRARNQMDEGEYDDEAPEPEVVQRAFQEIEEPTEDAAAPPRRRLRPRFPRR